MATNSNTSGYGVLYPFARRQVQSKLHFIPQTISVADPIIHVIGPPDGAPQQNFEVEVVDITFEDIRGEEKMLNLEVDGIIVQQVPSHVAIDWMDETNVKEIYYPKIKELVQKQLGENFEVLVYSHNTRKSEDNPEEKVEQPFPLVHFDQSWFSIQKRVLRQIKDEERARELLQGRVRLFNV